jgi:hypothetical protein
LGIGGTSGAAIGGVGGSGGADAAAGAWKTGAGNDTSAAGGVETRVEAVLRELRLVSCVRAVCDGGRSIDEPPVRSDSDVSRVLSREDGRGLGLGLGGRGRSSSVSVSVSVPVVRIAGRIPATLKPERPLDVAPVAVRLAVALDCVVFAPSSELRNATPRSEGRRGVRPD